MAFGRHRAHEPAGLTANVKAALSRHIESRIVLSFSSGRWPKYAPCTDPQQLVTARETRGGTQLQNAVHEYQAEPSSSKPDLGWLEYLF